MIDAAPVPLCRGCGVMLSTAAGIACGICGWCILRAKEADTLTVIKSPGYRGDEDGDDGAG